ncbi:unnamed protein product, partial [Coregonus sp. 'balchen']
MASVTEREKHPSMYKGQLLDEVSMQCVEPAQCHICYHNGERISHGKKVILNHDDPQHCQICHCENNTLSCEVCALLDTVTSTTPPAGLTTPTTLPVSTVMPEESCDRAMDLAFLLDGSAALSEEDFLSVKQFILSVVDRFRMGSAHTRATVLLYHSGVKTYDMQVQKWLFKKTVRELHYSGGDAAFLDEAVKYLAINIYDKNKREHAGRVAIILTASANPRPLRTTVKLLRKKDITTLTLALGPEASWTQVNDITKAKPDNRAYQLNSVSELPDNFMEVTDYLCTLGLEPETPKPLPAKPSIASLGTTTTTQPPLLEPIPSLTSTPSQHLPNPIQHDGLTPTTTYPSPSSLSSSTSSSTFPSSSPPSKDVTFILEGSDSVGEAGFNASLLFLEEVISQLADEGEESVRVTVIQYSVTVTVEITRWEIRWQRNQLLRRLREIRWRGGAKTNTGAAIGQTYQEVTTDRPSSTPTSPQLVFLVTENPPTDVIMRPPSSHTHTRVYPIGVGPKVREVDLMPLSSPQRPLMVEDYTSLTSLVTTVVNITRNTLSPRSPTLPPPRLTPTLAPRATLPPSVPCRKPMDVLFLLSGGNRAGPETDGQSEGDTEFEDMKTFVKAFVNSADIGRNETQVCVVTYGETSRVGVAWREEQDRTHLLTLVDQLTSPTHTHTALGAALRFAVQTSISPSSGGRVGVAKVVVMLVIDRSTDQLQEATNEALTAGVSVFPIGIGPGYNRAELSLLGSHGDQDNTLHLNSMEELLMLLTLDQSYTDKLCRGIVLDQSYTDTLCRGIVLDQSYTDTLCRGIVLDQSYTDTLCRGIVLDQSYTDTLCRGIVLDQSYTDTLCRGIVLDQSYTDTLCRGIVLDQSYTDTLCRGIVNCDRLEPPACSNHMSPLRVQDNCGCHWDCPCECMGSSTNHVVRFDGLALRLEGEGLCSYTLLTVGGGTGGSEVTLHSGTCHGSANQNEVCMKVMELRSVEHGYILAFTPQSNEFTITLTSSTTNYTSGICGWCGEERVNYLSLRNGSSTSDSSLLVSDWMVSSGEGVCVPRHAPVCVYGAARACEVLRSEVFSSCHTHVPIMPFIIRCQQEACQETDVCDDCSSIGLLPGTSGAVSGNGSVCITKPTEGCFCPRNTVLLGGDCVSPDACNQCVDQHGHKHPYLQSWVPEENTSCGPCEVLREKRESKCCPEYECGTTVLPGSMRQQFKPGDECVCDCHNATHSCPPGFITSSSTNDCGCTETACLPDQVCVCVGVCVVGGVVYRVGSQWEEGCEKCSCTHQQDTHTNLHIAQCVPPVCDHSCPL